MFGHLELCNSKRLDGATFIYHSLICSLDKRRQIIEVDFLLWICKCGCWQEFYPKSMRKQIAGLIYFYGSLVQHEFIRFTRTRIYKKKLRRRLHGMQITKELFKELVQHWMNSWFITEHTFPMYSFSFYIFLEIQTISIKI